MQPTSGEAAAPPGVGCRLGLALGNRLASMPRPVRLDCSVTARVRRRVVAAPTWVFRSRRRLGNAARVAFLCSMSWWRRRTAECPRTSTSYDSISRPATPSCAELTKGEEGRILAVLALSVPQKRRRTAAVSRGREAPPKESSLRAEMSRREHRDRAARAVAGRVRSRGRSAAAPLLPAAVSLLHQQGRRRDR